MRSIAEAEFGLRLSIHVWRVAPGRQTSKPELDLEARQCQVASRSERSKLVTGYDRPAIGSRSAWG